MNWYDGETYYTADYSGEITDEIRQRTQEAKTWVQMSWDTLKCNYFANAE